jgi:DNA-binding winged helix-turn-helix (wHTH) protein/Tol biopolymer transport system component
MKHCYTFGEFRLELDERRLLRRGEAIPLPPKVFDTLILLVENSGHLVTKDEFMNRLWAGTFVGEDTLARNISLLRKVLGEDYIATVPRHGYRLVVTVDEGTEEDEGAAGRSVFTPITNSHTEERPTANGGSAVVVANPTGAREALPAITHGAKHFRFTWLGVACLSLGVGLIGGFFTFRLLSPAPHREAVMIQVTANTSEDPVSSGAISPDGKYLAYTDKTGKIRVKLVTTGATRTVPNAETAAANRVNWEIGPWLPDSSRFIVNAHPASGPRFNSDGWNSQGTSAWMFSVLGVPPQKLRDEAEVMSVSSDGSLVAFATNAGPLGDREMWLMDVSGREARKIYDTAGDHALAALSWSPDGQRVIYLDRGKASRALVIRNLHGGPSATVLRFPDSTDPHPYVWLADGRLIYSSYETLGSGECVIWKLWVDPRSGKPVGGPQRVTSMEGLCDGITATADGKELAFLRSSYADTTYVAGMDAAGSLVATSIRHLTSEEYPNSAEGWTHDNKAIIFRSRRNGHVKLFKQAIDADTEQPLVMGAQDVGGSSASPDGSSLYYLDCAAKPDCDAAVPIMLVPISGGTPQYVLRSNTYGRPRCGISPGSLCVLAERREDGQPLVFTSFDVNGRGRELANFATEPGAAYSWGLSPGGTRIGVLRVGDSRIHVLSLNGEPPQVIRVKGWEHLVHLYWAADGNGWFTSGLRTTAAVLLHVDSQGNAASLWEAKGAAYAYALPSPDGRHVAIVSTVAKSNVWLLENF